MKDNVSILQESIKRTETVAEGTIARICVKGSWSSILTYAAVFVAGRWWPTGASTPDTMTPEEFAKWCGRPDVISLAVADTFTTVFGEDEEN